MRSSKSLERFAQPPKRHLEWPLALRIVSFIPPILSAPTALTTACKIADSLYRLYVTGLNVLSTIAPSFPHVGPAKGSRHEGE
jgi:hypothetical protein